MRKRIHILILEDNPADAELMKREMRKGGLDFTARVAQDRPSFLRALDESTPDLILADYVLPAFDAMAALAIARQRFPGIPVIIVSGAIGEETAVEALKAGATDCVLKDRLGRLVPAVLRAMQEAEYQQALRLAQQQMEAERAMLQAVLKALPVAVFIADASGKLVQANDAANEIWGGEVPLVGISGYGQYRGWRADSGERIRPEEWAMARAVLKGETSVGEEIIIERFDGARRTILHNAAPVRGLDGRVIGGVVVAEDITRQKHVQDELRENAARLQAILDNAPVVIAMKDVAGRYLMVNPAFEALVGKKQDEIIGKAVWELGDGESAERLRKIEEEVIRTGRPIASEEPFAFLPESGRIFLTVRAPVFDQEGKVHAICLIAADITELKQREEQLVKARGEADAANAAKSQFLASMSHEIRTPMTAIIGMMDLILGTELTDEQRQYAGMVKQSGRALLDIINDILDFSRIERGMLQLRVEPFALSRLIDATLETLSVMAHQKGLELLHFTGLGVPDLLVGDPVRLREIIVNIVGNAIKFTDRGEVAIRTEAESLTAEHVVLHASITDTGIGIAKESLATIFDAFAQLEGPKKGGTGLGLSICSKLVGMMGGRIWVESEMGQGSTFHFTARLNLQAVPQPQPVRLPELKGRRVLIVDDNPSARRIAEKLVSEHGAVPASAGNADEALHALAATKRAGQPFAYALIDAHLPEMDGLALAHKIEDNPESAATRIILAAPTGEPEYVGRCRELRAAACVLKPICRARLYEALKAAVSLPPVEITKPHPAVAARPLRILIAEDNDALQMLATTLLVKRGHEVAVASNGLEALDRLEKEQFDVVLMDIRMPEMDGLAAARAIREREQPTGEHLPIIGLTAAVMQEERDAALLAGMDVCIAKPYEPEELFEVVEHHAAHGRKKAVKV